jgi:hypothetical protein
MHLEFNLGILNLYFIIRIFKFSICETMDVAYLCLR